MQTKPTLPCRASPNTGRPHPHAPGGPPPPVISPTKGLGPGHLHRPRVSHANRRVPPAPRGVGFAFQVQREALETPARGLGPGLSLPFPSGANALVPHWCHSAAWAPARWGQGPLIFLFSKTPKNFALTTPTELWGKNVSPQDADALQGFTLGSAWVSGPGRRPRLGGRHPDWAEGTRRPGGLGVCDHSRTQSPRRAGSSTCAESSNPVFPVSSVGDPVGELPRALPLEPGTVSTDPRHQRQDVPLGKYTEASARL